MKSSKYFIYRLSLLAALAAVSPIRAATVALVPGNDIQAAMDAARPGDVVRLAPGVYPVPRGLVMRNGVALEGESRDAVTLDGGRRITDSPVENAVVFPSTITDARTRISNLTVTGMHGTRGGGFRVNGARRGAISGNRIRGNFATNQGSAIFVDGDAGPEFLIAFNLIHHNRDSQGVNTHAVELAGPSSPTIQNNTVAYNDDNGIFVASSCPWPLLANNILFRNGRDFAPSVVLDPATLEPVSGFSDNVGRGTCYFPPPPAPGVRIAHNLFCGNQRAALLVGGSSNGDWESPLALEARESYIAGSRYLPRGVGDDVLFADAARFDFRIRAGSAAYLAGDPAIASSQGVLHIGAEQEPVQPQSSASAFRRGDANADGSLDISDPVSILEHLFLVPGPLACEDAADVDDDGKLLITDPIVLLEFLFLDGPAPRQPHPGCGDDPTPDFLGCRGFEACASAGRP